MSHSDVYVLLLAFRYGTRTEGGAGPSITELEFDQAVASGKPIYAYVMNFILDAAEGMDSDPVGMERLARFKEKVGRHCTPAFCTSLQDHCERLQRLAANPPTISGSAPAAAPVRTFSLEEINRWISSHHAAVARCFEAIPAVQDRSLHVDLPVDLRAAGSAGSRAAKVMLTPVHLQPALEAMGTHLVLITGQGGAGKTSLAFQIARWGLEGSLADPILPALIDTALALEETVLQRVRQWLERAIGARRGSLDQDLVAELLRRKRRLVIIDHFSELPEPARRRVLATLSTGLLILTSREPESGIQGELAITRVEPLQIAIDQLQRFFHEVLERKGVRERFSDDDLEPTQRQLRRMVGDKPITPLLAQMFIEDVIAKQEGQGVLAASVPELMLAYVNRISEVIPAEERQQEGIAIEADWVQRGLMAIALTSHRQGPQGRPRLQPMSFERELALEALAAVPGLEEPARRQALLAYLLRLRLLHHPGQNRSEFRLALDPLADYLAALRQLELLAEEERRAVAPGDDGGDPGQVVWERFLTALERRPRAELDPMRGFLLALRDGCLERIERPRGATTIPAGVPDRLGSLAGLDPAEERRRQQRQRVRKLIYELAVPEGEDRLRALQVLATMAAAADAAPRLGVREATSPLVAVARERDGQRPVEERQAALDALAAIGGLGAAEALQAVLTDSAEDSLLRRRAAEALGRIPAEGSSPQAHWELLERTLRSVALDHDSDQERIEAVLPLLQGSAWGLQLLAARQLPLWQWGPGREAGRVVPMLSLTCKAAGDQALVITTEVVDVAVWRLPLPEGIPLQLVEIPAWEGRIGSPDEEEGRLAYGHRPECEGRDVEALRRVSLPAFAMARTPISQVQWRAVAELEPVVRDIPVDPATEKGAELPVETVSWNDAQEWCARLNRFLRNALGEHVPQVALTSESQWEVACRAGTTTPFHCGVAIDPGWANYDGTYTYGVGTKGAYLNKPSPVGSYGLVNRWGLADMHGNVWEWCADLWHPSAEGAPADGSAWLQRDAELKGVPATYRLLRGGSWPISPRLCRSAYRNGIRPDFRSDDFGFRVCCLPPGSS